MGRLPWGTVSAARRPHPLIADWAWRIPSLLQALASVLQILLIYALPESPRWLVENGKTEEAARVLTKYHAGGNPNDPLIELELAEIHMAIETDKEINETTSYLTLFRNKANRSRTLIIIAIGFFSQWSGNGLISYYLSLILSSVGYTSSQDQLMINGVLQAFSLVTAIGGALVVNRFKRRTLWLTSTVGIFVVFIGKHTVGNATDMQSGQSASRCTRRATTLATQTSPPAKPSSQ
jgi:MFS family permease